MFKRHLLGYQGHQTAPGYKDGTPGIYKKNEEDQRNNTTRNLSKMSNPIGLQQPANTHIYLQPLQTKMVSIEQRHAPCHNSQLSPMSCTCSQRNLRMMSSTSVSTSRKLHLH